MDSAVAFDTLAAARALEAAGMERRHAEAVAEVTASARADQGELATKADLAAAVAATKADIAAGLAGLEARMEQQEVRFEARMEQQEARAEARIARAEARIYLALAGLLVAQSAVFASVLAFMLP